ncbi:hypothetical protein BDV25DRAFT_166559 [Aspergillus avenaceus]|uniref:Uncharacterized protein n=1 Tax=Aspergillus avenaceus TaxID=36643 RepID=A0A5N6TDV8_ASPAV|nr:hypothetical protein BDV25DRAFT_166559 [Aspergillus avenaceus]
MGLHRFNGPHGEVRIQGLVGRASTELSIHAMRQPIPFLSLSQIPTQYTLMFFAGLKHFLFVSAVLVVWCLARHDFTASECICKRKIGDGYI